MLQKCLDTVMQDINSFSKCNFCKAWVGQGCIPEAAALPHGRFDERLVNHICAYTPQLGRSENLKKKFFKLLFMW